MNKFMLQLSLKDYQLERYTKTLKKLNIDYHFFSVYSDINKIGNFPQDFEMFDYIAFAGIKAVKISLNPLKEHFNNEDEYRYKEKYKNAFFYRNKNNFDQNYCSGLNLPMLNKEAQYLIASDSLEKKFDKDMFIKPSSDLKGFSAGIIKAHQTIKDYIDNSSRQNCWSEEMILISNLEKIHSEYRFFVVDKEILAFSKYREKNTVKVEVEIPEHIKKCAENYAKLYQPDAVFVMDLALLEDGQIKIVEYNCFNGSGTYAADLVNLFDNLKNRNMNTTNSCISNETKRKKWL